MAPAWVPLAVAVIALGGVLVGIVVQDRRERRRAAEMAAERTETEMERVLRARIKLRDEQIAALEARVDELTVKVQQMSEQITALGGKP